MEKIEQVKFFKIIEWNVFIILLALSGYFMYEVLEQYISGKSSFAQSEKQITELPTMTFCFSSNGEYDGDVEYQYGTDFKIEYLIEWPPKSFGFLEVSKEIHKFNEIITFEKLITSYSGSCYKVSAKGMSIEKGKYTILLLHFVKTVPYDKLPHVKVYITSEENSYGVVRQRQFSFTFIQKWLISQFFFNMAFELMPSLDTEPPQKYIILP